MKIWLAGTTVAPATSGVLGELFKKAYKLHSYYHCQKKGFEHNWWKMNIKNKVKLFLDSGGFSAFTQNAVIDIKKYIKFIRRHKKDLEVYANLDVIGCPKGTWKNQRIMEKAGLNPLPCFHYAEDTKWLERYINAGHEYIALGGMVPISTKDLRVWLDHIFDNFICDENGMPKIKVHGFGMTSLKLMQRYPWYSVDSTSWVVTGRLGGVYIPKFRDGKWIYDEDSWKIQVSSRSPCKTQAGKHIDSLSPEIQAIFWQYFVEKGYVLGESGFREEDEKYELAENERWHGKAVGGKRTVETIIIPGLCNDYKLRDELNIIYFLDLEKSMPEWPWAFKRKGVVGFAL